MPLWIGLGGWGLTLAGAAVVALADDWFSRSILLYLDALELHLAQVVQVLQNGGSKFAPSAVNLRRDQAQNRARGLKLLGWCLLLAGCLVQVAVLALAAPSLSLYPAP